MTTKVKPSVLADTAVTAGTYGGATQQAVFSVDAQGRLVYAGNATPSIATSQLTGTIAPSTMSNTFVYGISTSGNSGTSTNATTAANATAILAGNWTITPSGTKINFAYSGNIVFSIDSTGKAVAKSNIVSFGTP